MRLVSVGPALRAAPFVSTALVTGRWWLKGSGGIRANLLIKDISNNIMYVYFFNSIFTLRLL